MKDHIKFILKNSIIFAIVSFSFSMIGAFFPENEFTVVIGNPLVVSSVTYEHVLGHVFWGAVIGLGTLSIRYIILGGSFAIFLDSDHLLQFLDIELVSRMSHSIPFAVIVSIVFFVLKFFSGKFDFFNILNNYKITIIHMRGVGCFVFSSYNF